MGPEGPEGPEGKMGKSATIIVPDDESDIQFAIGLLPKNGGTVYIKAGTYLLTKGIHINKPNITITGETGTLLKLDAGVNQPVILIGSDVKVPSIAIENIRIENLEIDGNMSNQSSENDPARIWIRNNGIDVRMVNDLFISKVDIHHAISGGLVISWDCNRVFVDRSSFHENFYDGIALYASRDIQVSSFFCYENGYAGLSLDNELSDVLFSDGSIKKNGDVGIFVRNSQRITFNALLIEENIGSGCFMSHEYGIRGSGVQDILFNASIFRDNIGFAIWLASPVSESFQNTILGCVFSGNKGGSIRIDLGGELLQNGNVYQ
jgi:hypothetical protein